MTRIEFEMRLRDLKAENMTQARELARLNRGVRADHLRQLFQAVARWEEADRAFKRAPLAEPVATPVVIELETSAYLVRLAAARYVRSIRRAMVKPTIARATLHPRSAARKAAGA